MERRPDRWRYDETPGEWDIIVDRLRNDRWLLDEQKAEAIALVEVIRRFTGETAPPAVLDEVTAAANHRAITFFPRNSEISDGVRARLLLLLLKRRLAGAASTAERPIEGKTMANAAKNNELDDGQATIRMQQNHTVSLRYAVACAAVALLITHSLAMQALGDGACIYLNDDGCFQSCTIAEGPLCEIFNDLFTPPGSYEFQGDGTTCPPGPPEAICCFGGNNAFFGYTECQCNSEGGWWPGPDGNFKDCQGGCYLPEEELCDHQTTMPLCEANGGTWYQGDTTCARGACCHPDGACYEGPELWCQEVNGIYMGLGTTCGPSACPGGCCIPQDCGPDFCEIVASESECIALGGDWHGSPPCQGGSFCGSVFNHCCLPEGVCDPTVTGPNCIDLGGMPVYDCLSGDCDICVPMDAFGACCYDDAECVVTTGEICFIEGGHYAGDGTDCSDVDCSMGACCLTADDCLQMSEADCNAGGGGTFIGFGAACTDDDSCPLGACYFGDAGCVQMTQELCEAQSMGGVWLGAGSVCPGPGDPSGCCAIDQNTGVQMAGYLCAEIGGTYLGDNTSCDALDLSLGSCRTPDGTCTDLTEAECKMAGGSFGGWGTMSNGDGSCNIGACLYPDGSCVYVGPAECEQTETGGAWGGAECDCSDQDCICEYAGPESSPHCPLRVCCFGNGTCKEEELLQAGQDCIIDLGGVWIEAESCDEIDPCECYDTETDSDGDGLLDFWEASGGICYQDSDGNWHQYELPGANIARKDLYLEIDVMSGSDPALVTEALEIVRDAFDQAPVDGGLGVALHVLPVDEVNIPSTQPADCIDLSFIQNDDPSAFGSVPGYFGSVAERDADPDTVTARLAAKRKAYRYGLIVPHVVDAQTGATISGIANFWSAGGNEFMAATLVQDKNGVSPASARLLAGRIMHEFGHVLSLTHGGADETNFKPNHISVMNYNWEFILAVNGSNLPVDYSRADVYFAGDPPPGSPMYQPAELHECSLDESRGMLFSRYTPGLVVPIGYDTCVDLPPSDPDFCAGAPTPPVYPRCLSAGAIGRGVGWIDLNGGPINWDGDYDASGQPNPIPNPMPLELDINWVGVNVPGDNTTCSPRELMRTYNEWDLIKFPVSQEPIIPCTHPTLGGTQLSCGISADLRNAILEALPPAPITCRADCGPISFDGSYGDGVVNETDLLELLAAWGTDSAICDIAPKTGDGEFGDGVVNVTDLLAVLAAWGPCE